jgi:CheY-like chemotaxis protein
MDAQMPVRSGAEAAKEILNNGCQTFQPKIVGTIMMISFKSAKWRKLCLEAGMVDVISKPFNRDALYECICSLAIPASSVLENQPAKTGGVGNETKRKSASRDMPICCNDGMLKGLEMQLERGPSDYDFKPWGHNLDIDHSILEPAEPYSGKCLKKNRTQSFEFVVSGPSETMLLENNCNIGSRPGSSSHCYF